MYAIERIPRDRADASPLAFLYFLRHLAPLDLRAVRFHGCVFENDFKSRFDGAAAAGGIAGPLKVFTR